MKISKVEKADLNTFGPTSRRNAKGRKFLKSRKVRAERRRANAEPETQPGYGKYRGWES